MKINPNKVYLGDGVYAEFTDGSVWLTTSDGLEEIDRICLEPEVLAAFLSWLSTLKRGNPDAN